MIFTSTVSPSLKIGLQLLGVWPRMSHSIFYWLIYISSILIIQYFQYLYIFAHFKISELSNLVEGLSLTLDYSLSFLKLSSLWVHRRVLQQILTVMDNDWRECIGIDQHLYVMTVKASISHFCSNAMLSFNAIAGIFYLLGGYVIRFYLIEDYNNTLREYPIKVQFPFEIEHSSIFVLLVVTLFLHVMSNACVIATLNGLMLALALECHLLDHICIREAAFTLSYRMKKARRLFNQFNIINKVYILVLHVSGQIDIICQEFKTISENILYYGSSTSLRILIERHNKVISLSDNIKKLFSFIVLMQVFWNTLVICCLGSVIVISIHYETDIFMIMKTAFAYIAMMTETFVVCFIGEYLTLKGKSIADAAYDMLWYDLPSNQGKIIIFIILRSQKRLAITAGKMMEMSFEAFTSILKASASYVSVLHAIY